MLILLQYQWKGKKEQCIFLLSFPEHKEDKENSEQAWTFLVPNSECV